MVQNQGDGVFGLERCARQAQATTSGEANGPRSRRAFNHYEKCNEAEREFLDFARLKGAECHRNGWPDFFVRLEDGGICGVEVKRGYGDPLKDDQVSCARLLEEIGVPVYVWNKAATANFTDWYNETDKLIPWRRYVKLEEG